MTTADRQRRARNLCRRLGHDVAAVSPEGLGRSLPDTHPARAASDRFLDVLANWEREAATVDQVREAYDAALEAWRQAAAVFKTKQQLSRKMENSP